MGVTPKASHPGYTVSNRGTSVRGIVFRGGHILKNQVDIAGNPNSIRGILVQGGHFWLPKERPACQERTIEKSWQDKNRRSRSDAMAKKKACLTASF